MIEKQGFRHRPKTVTKEDVFNTIDKLGCIQIDTINVVERAHHLTLWSRLGAHDKEILHDLAYRDRLLFEHWAHAASYIPLKDFRFFIHAMNIRREKIRENSEKWEYGIDWSRVDPDILEKVLERAREEGPLATRDFEHKRERPSDGWWDWKPAKVILEALLGAGVLLVSRRENFQRYYDLSERVLPEWVETDMPPEDDRVRFFVSRPMGCLGLLKATDIRKYYLPWCVILRRTSKQLQAILNDMVEEDRAFRFAVEGEKQPYFCLPEDVDRISELEDGDLGFGGVRFLTNFDNLLWDRERVKNLFGFEAKLETYIPADKRKYGYYNLPILSGDRLVGRIVPRMDRDEKTLVIESVWHEPWFEPDADFEDSFAETMESFAEFNGAEGIEMVEKKPRIG
ncbi:MAG: winged helix DNA-binding domain-containing protein [Candidatus Bathyarchaeota archaeon]|nr:winged helix DNA-binding domain-containing protein [Candidatus Bathyarchaeota archaeon]